MANEAILLIEMSSPIPMTCADGAGIEKGTLLQLTDPMTVSASSADNEISIGIAAAEKIASDGVTKCPVYIDGIFRMKDSGSGVTAGDLLKIAGANLVATADDAGAQGGKEVVGKALETAGASETLAVLVGKQ